MFFMRRNQRSFLSAGILVSAGLLAASCSSLSEAAASPGANETSIPEETSDTPRVKSGIAVPGGDPATLDAVENSLDVDFSVIRIFARWNTAFPDADDQAILDRGHAIHLSVRPRTDDGVVVPWSEMAAAQPGSAVYAEMEAWADKAILVGDDGYFTLNHEPETRDSSGNGEAEDFKAAWRAFTAILRERGGENISMAWIMTGGAFSDGRADEWYPGDDVVDVVGTDPYNWYLCQGTTRDWRTFDDLVSPALEWAEAHDKPLVVPEFASAEDKAMPGRKAEWILDAAKTLATPRYQAGVEYVAWFSVHDGNYPDCDWNFDSSPESADAFAELMQSLS